MYPHIPKYYKYYFLILINNIKPLSYNKIAIYFIVKHSCLSEIGSFSVKYNQYLTTPFKIKFFI